MYLSPRCLIVLRLFYFDCDHCQVTGESLLPGLMDSNLPDQKVKSSNEREGDSFLMKKNGWFHDSWVLVVEKLGHIRSNESTESDNLCTWYLPLPYFNCIHLHIV